MLIGTVSTPHYEIAGLGKDTDELNEALINRWKEFCNQNPDADPSLMQDLIDGGDVSVYDLEPGQAKFYGIE